MIILDVLLSIFDRFILLIKWLNILFFLVSLALCYVCASGIYITEVYYDGSDEWIELYNNTSISWSWQISLEWTKSTTLSYDNVVLEPYQTVLIVDKEEQFVEKDTLSFLSKDTWLSLYDTRVLEVILYYSWSNTWSDTFFVWQEDIVLYNNTNTSFHKVCTQYVCEQAIPTREDEAVWIHAWLLWSPGVVITPEIFSDGGESLPTYHSWDSWDYIVSTWFLGSGTLYSWSFDQYHEIPWTWFWLVSSWADTHILSWDVFSGNSWERVWEVSMFSWSTTEEVHDQSNEDNISEESIVSSIDAQGTIDTLEQGYTPSKISIREIHAYDFQDIPEYIELLAREDVSETLSIAWLWQWSAVKEVYIDAHAWQRIIVSDGSSPYFSSSYIHIPSISLTDWWEWITVFWQNGQVLDKIVYNLPHRWSSLYRWVYSGDTAVFDVPYISTPWFSKHQALYIEERIRWSSFSCHIGIQNKTPLYADKKVNIVAYANGEQITNASSSYRCERYLPDTEESFTGCNPSYFSYSKPWLHTMYLTMYSTSWTICSTQYTINYPEHPKHHVSSIWKKPYTEKKSSEVSSSNEQPSYYEWLYRKWKERYMTLKWEVKNVWYTVSTSWYISASTTQTIDIMDLQQWTGTYALSIEGILPNPAWKDTAWTEAIFFSGDLSLLSWMYIFQWTKYINIPSEISSYSDDGNVMYTWQLRNSPSCVYLTDKTYIYDTFCYLETKDDVWTFTSVDILSRVYTNSLQSFLWSISVKQFDNESCLVYKKENILCTHLDVSQEEYLSLKQEAKKSKKREKDISRLEKKIETVQKNYDKEKSKRKSDKEMYKKSVDKLRQEKNLLQNQLRLDKQFISILTHQFKEEWYTLYQEEFAWYAYVYDILDTLSDMQLYEKFWFFPEDIASLHAFMQETLPLETLDIATTYSRVLSDSRDVLDIFLFNLRHEK